MKKYSCPCCGIVIISEHEIACCPNSDCGGQPFSQKPAQLQEEVYPSKIFIITKGDGYTGSEICCVCRTRPIAEREATKIANDAGIKKVDNPACFFFSNSDGGDSVDIEEFDVIEE